MASNDVSLILLVVVSSMDGKRGQGMKSSTKGDEEGCHNASGSHTDDQLALPDQNICQGVVENCFAGATTLAIEKKSLSIFALSYRLHDLLESQPLIFVQLWQTCLSLSSGLVNLFFTKKNAFPSQLRDIA